MALRVCRLTNSVEEMVLDMMGWKRGNGRGLRAWPGGRDEMMPHRGRSGELEGNVGKGKGGPWGRAPGGDQ